MRAFFLPEYDANPARPGSPGLYPERYFAVRPIGVRFLVVAGHTKETAIPFLNPHGEVIPPLWGSASVPSVGDAFQRPLREGTGGINERMEGAFGLGHGHRS